MPAVLGTVDPDEKHAVGNFGIRITRGLGESGNMTFHPATSWFGACIAVELAEQGIAVLLGRVGQLLDEGFDLLAGGVFEGLGAAEVDGVGFHQFGIELVLADESGRADRGPCDRYHFRSRSRWCS